MGPKQQSKSEQLRAAREAKATGTAPASLAFSIEEARPVSVGKSAEMTPLHVAILATLDSKQAVRVPLPEGKNAVQVQRICRYPLLKNGHLGKGKGVTFRRVISVDHIKVWLEPKKATKSKEERAKEKAEREARKAAKKPKAA